MRQNKRKYCFTTVLCRVYKIENFGQVPDICKKLNYLKKFISAEKSTNNFSVCIIIQSFSIYSRSPLYTIKYLLINACTQCTHKKVHLLIAQLDRTIAQIVATPLLSKSIQAKHTSRFISIIMTVFSKVHCRNVSSSNTT